MWAFIKTFFLKLLRFRVTKALVKASTRRWSHLERREALSCVQTVTDAEVDAADIREQAKTDGRKPRPERDWISLLYLREDRVYEAA